MTSPSCPGNDIKRLAFLLRALRYRNYRLFFGGQIVSLIGTWMTMTASAWLVYRLSHSAFLLGVVGFAGQLPAFLLAPVSGVYVDRWNRYQVLVATQTLSMLQSFSLAILTLTGLISIPAIIVLNAFQGLVNAFDMPCRQAFLIQMIDNKEDLGNAIALNSSMVNAARLLGPTIAGILIAAYGEGFCYLVDGFSYSAVIAALLAMHGIKKEKPRPSGLGPLQELHEGWRYVAHSLPIRSLILLLALVSLVGVPYTVLMPVFAGTILGHGPNTLGYLMSATGAGAIAGALWLAARRSVLGLGKMIPAATLLFGSALIAFSLSRVLWLSLLILPLAGFGFMVQLAASNTIVQTIVEDRMRGRVMSFYMMAFLGTAPFGSLISGSLASRIGAPNTLIIGGLCCIAGALLFVRRLPEMRAAARDIYVEKGILPEVAKGLQTAAEVTLPPED